MKNKSMARNGKKHVATLLLILLLTSSAVAANNTTLTSNTDEIAENKDSAQSIADNTKTESNRRIFTEIETTPLTNENEIPASRVAINIKPEKQTTLDRTATYEITIKAHFLPNTDATKTTEYELDFDPENRGISGEFSKETVSLRPGEREKIKLKILAETPGEHHFAVEVKSEEGYEAESEGLLHVIDSNTEPSQKIRLDLQPEKKYTDSGSSDYEVIISRPLETPCYSNTECAELYEEQEYEVIFVSEQKQLEGMFTDDNIVKLKPGEKEKLQLATEAEEEGTYVFKIIAKTQAYNKEVKGLLVYGKEPETTSTPSFFEGEGFAINEDESDGTLAHINIVGDNGDLRGKMAFYEESYALKGEVSSDNEISLNIYNIGDGGFDSSIGEFQGEIKAFDNFATLEGEIDFELFSGPNQKWEITFIGKHKSIFEKEIIVVESNTPVTKTINKEEVVTIRQGSLEDKNTEKQETYIVPEKIQRKRIFGIIPNPWGEKILNLKLVEGNKITEETLNEFGTKTIGDYEVSVGSLENEEAIEVSIIQKD